MLSMENSKEEIFLKPENIVFTSIHLELLHIDLFGLVKTASINGKKYRLVIVDEYNRWTLVKFLIIKNEAYDVFNTFCTKVQAEKELKLLRSEAIMEENQRTSHL